MGKKKKKEVTMEMIREAHLQYHRRKSDAEAFVRFAEEELAVFIRVYKDKNFTSIYAECRHQYYRQLCQQIPRDTAMKQADEEADYRYSQLLKAYASFLESKHYTQLFKTSIVGPAEKAKSQAKTLVLVEKERELTEGEKKHVAYEAAQRNPKLRQACLELYGYQCQCCGMDFVSLYGEALGTGFIEVHHLQMISTFDDGQPTDYVANLVPLCANCHTMIHRGPNGPITLGELRAVYRGEQKPLKIRKDD